MSQQTITDNSRRIVQGFYDDALSGRFEQALKAFDDKLIVHEPSFLPYGGVSHGPDGFAALFATIARYISIESIQLHSLVADGEVVVTYLTAKTADTGDRLDISERSIVRDGRIVEMKIYYHEGGSLISGDAR